MSVWLVTGAGRGMGTQFVSAALDAGHAVIATGRAVALIVTAVVALATATSMRWSGLFLSAELGGAIFPDDGGLWLTGASFLGLGLWMLRRPAHERVADEAVR